MLRAAILLLASSLAAAQRPVATAKPPLQDVVYEASISDLQTLMSSGRATSVQLVDAYFARIAAYDHAGPKLNAMIRLNPKARAAAARLAAERSEPWGSSG